MALFGVFRNEPDRYVACFSGVGDSFAPLSAPVVRGRERCDNRLSYSNIGDEQLTI